MIECFCDFGFFKFITSCKKVSEKFLNEVLPTKDGDCKDDMIIKS